MSTPIEWTDVTWNPVTGCTKVSPGCAHCYIERTPAFRTKGIRFERGRIPVQLHPDRLEAPLHWRAPRRVRALAKRHHPDVGGSAEAMATINDALERIRGERG